MKKHNRNIAVKLIIGLIIVLLCVIIIIDFYNHIDHKKFAEQIDSIGLSILFIFVPYLFIMLSDTVGWYNCFGKKMRQIWLGKLYLIRFATETLQTSLPGGTAYAELVRPFILKKQMNLEYPKSVSADIITKVNILAAQVMFLLLGILILVIKFKDNIIPEHFLSGTYFYTTAVVFISLIFILSYLLYRKNLLLHIINMLEKINLKIVGKLLNKIRQPSVEINNTLSVFYTENKSGMFLTTSFFFLTWILMAVESLIILKVMGIDANIFQMIMLESFISVVRMMFFFLPGAVGPQDVSIIMMFSLAGLPDPVINSILFVLLKRTKELFWIIIGYILLMYYGVGIKKLSGIKQSPADLSPERIPKV